MDTIFRRFATLTTSRLGTVLGPSAVLFLILSGQAAAAWASETRVTLLGGSDEEEILGLSVAPDATVYVAGWTASADFPATPGAADRDLGGQRDAFVARLSADLGTLLAATLLGGAEKPDRDPGAWDAAYDVVATADGVWVTGFTRTRDFPVTSGAVDTTNEGEGASVFVARLSPDLATVERATYLGGRGTDLAYALALDGDGSVLVAGYTLGSEFPTTEGAWDRVGSPVADSFVSRLDPELGKLEASTLFAASSAKALALAPDGAVYLAGVTDSIALPTTEGALDRSCGTDGGCNTDGFGRAYSDGFVARFDHDLGRLDAATYLGRAGDDIVEAMTMDASGRLWVAGTTGSPDFPTTEGAFQAHGRGVKAMFVARLGNRLETLDAATLLSGAGPFTANEAFDVAVDRQRVALVGETFAAGFPTTEDAIDRTLDGANEGVFAILDSQLTTLEHARFLGGSAGARPEEDQPRALVVTDDGTVYVAGRTAAPDFPVSGDASQLTPAGHFDGFVARFPMPPADAAADRPQPTSDSTGGDGPRP